MRLRSYSSSVLALSGIILMGLGLYFIFIRPPVLPEDSRYMGATLAEIQATKPGLLTWLRRVFWVTLAPNAHMPWRAVPGSAGVAIDPVCGMSVEPEKAIQIEWKGQIYSFCAQGCRNEFIEDPQKFNLEVS